MLGRDGGKRQRSTPVLGATLSGEAAVSEAPLLRRSPKDPLTRALHLVPQAKGHSSSKPQSLVSFWSPGYLPRSQDSVMESRLRPMVEAPGILQALQQLL